MKGQIEILLAGGILDIQVYEEATMTIYENTILNWLKDMIKKEDFHDLYCTMKDGNAQKIADILNDQLF